MSNIQTILDGLKPYVIGIRILDGLQVVDVVFKDGWVLPDSTTVSKTAGDDNLNYYMLHSDKEGVGIDDLLEYVKLTIKTNDEREKTNLLFKERVNDLKNLFKQHSLSKLRTLRFSFSEESISTPIEEFELYDKTPTQEQPKLIEREVIEAPHEEPQEIAQTNAYTEEELEILEEEARAKKYFQIKDKKNLNKLAKVELPPKISQAHEVLTQDAECECGPEEACSKCIDRKGY